ncbi:hypothetical protein [Corynebacterium sp.]|uniref:hypothetical protein n=1 Tax=Corynebacterium sp. TaxID=1720 RepID=UPI0028AC854C|nr:hypothetical protein [Corynebacterium sp.]
MTDITDNEKRVLREWAEKNKLRDEETHLAARYILANVDAPAPTLAEEMRGLASEYEEDGEPDPSVDLYRLADRVEQIEQERDEARAEVERLTEVNERLRKTDNYREFREFLHPVRVSKMPPGDIPGTALPINISAVVPDPTTPDPADVKPGEAWIVECRGERRNAVKDNGLDIPWNTINADGWYLSEDNGDVTPITRLVTAPRVITNPDELDRAKRCTVIRDAAGVVCERDAMGDYWTTFTSLANQKPHIEFPATVLWEPEE